MGRYSHLWLEINAFTYKQVRALHSQSPQSGGTDVSRIGVNAQTAECSAGLLGRSEGPSGVGRTGAGTGVGVAWLRADSFSPCELSPALGPSDTLNSQVSGQPSPHSTLLQAPLPGGRDTNMQSLPQDTKKCLSFLLSGVATSPLSFYDDKF